MKTKPRRAKPIKPRKIAVTRPSKAAPVTQDDGPTPDADGEGKEPSRKRARKLPKNSSTEPTTAAAAKPEVGGAIVAVAAPAAGDAKPLSQFCTKFKAKRPLDVDERPKADQQQRNQVGEGADDEVEKNEEGGPAVQIVNGEIVLQENSMVLHGNVKPPAEEDEEYQVVEEEDKLGVPGSTYSSFSKKQRRSKRWNVEETKMFYDALRQIGPDFVTMESFFAATTKRTRRTLKLKYKKELIDNPQLVEAALTRSCSKQIDLSIFDVTESDIPTSVRPVKVVKEQPDGSDEKAGPSEKQPKNETEGDEEMAVVEEDAAEMFESTVDAEPNPPKKGAGSLSNAFWAENEAAEPEKPAASEDVDPMLEDGEAPEEAPAISLVSTTNTKKKSKKPKFRSRKKGK